MFNQMLHWLRERLQQADGVPNYHLGPIYDTSGARRFVMDAEFGLPVQLIRGPGRIPVDSLRVQQNPQVLVPLAVPAASVGGTGTTVGVLELQGLHTQDDLGI